MILALSCVTILASCAAMVFSMRTIRQCRRLDAEQRKTRR